MWICQTQFGRQETSTHMLILQQHKACKKQLCRYGSPNNCQEVPIVKGSKQLTSDYLEWKEHLNRCNHGIPPEIFLTVNKPCVYNPAQNPSQDHRYLTEAAFDVDIKRWGARSKFPGIQHRQRRPHNIRTISSHGLQCLLCRSAVQNHACLNGHIIQINVHNPAEP